MTMTHIETVTVGSGGAASITFMSVGDIPDTYTDLVLKLSLRASNAVNFFTLSLNGSTSNFTQRTLQGTGSGVSSSSRTDSLLRQSVNESGFTASTFANSSFYFPNYRSAVAKSFSGDAVTENNATLSYQTISANLWNDTSAITSITLTANALFVEHSSASLFGITAGSDGIVTVS